MYRHKDFTTTVNSPQEAVILADIGGILTAGGSDITVVPEIQRMKFSKNFWNVAFSSFATLTKFAFLITIPVFEADSSRLSAIDFRLYSEVPHQVPNRTNRSSPQRLRT